MNAPEVDSQTGATPERPSDSAVATVHEAGREMRAPWAAGIAGILFSVLFTAALVTIRSQPLFTATDEGLAEIFEFNRETLAAIGGLYLAPFAGIAFLWFIAVVRDQVGQREDQFFATVFLGSGLIFVTLFFIAAAVASSLIVGVNYLGQAPPTADEVAAARALSYTLLFAFATRAGAVFLITTATISLRSRTFPRWLAFLGYALAAVLLVGVSFWDWIILVLPAWVAVISVVILRRERSRVRLSRAGASASGG